MMGKLKRYLSVFLAIVMIFSIMPYVRTKAEEKKMESGWTVKNIELSHKSVQFTIDGVENAQDATVVVTDRENGNVSFEGKFSITSSSQKIKVDIADGYLKAGSYEVYVKNSAGEKTESEYASMYNHESYLWISGDAYPNCYIGKMSSISSLPSDLKFKVSGTVGFNTYEGTVDEDRNVKIEYPAQDIGTILKIKLSDEYGCEYDCDAAIKNVSFSKVSLSVWHNGISVSRYDKLDKSERIGVKADGQVYYSDYGAGTGISGDSNTRLIVSYPDIKADEVSIWYESKYGSSSEAEKLNVKACSLGDCDYTAAAYQYRAEGKVTANSMGQLPNKVRTMLDGTEYNADINSDGTFTIEYPAQENYKEIVLQFLDQHGCIYEKTVSVYNSLSNMSPDIDKEAILPKTASMREAIENVRLVALIGNEEYFGEYGQKFVEYPYQTPGTDITFWLEERNSGVSEKQSAKIFDGDYAIELNARTGSLEGDIYAGDISSDYSADIEDAYVLIKGKKYACKLKKQTETDENTTYYHFSAKYPIQKIGTEIEISFTDSNQIEVQKKIKLKNIPPQIKVDKIDSSTTKISGKTVGKSKVTIKVGKKKYTCKAGNSGKFSKKIKAQNKGTEVSISVVTPEGYNNTKKVKIKSSYGTLWITNYIYKSSDNIKIKLTNARKGDSVKVLIGSRKYLKKVNSNKKVQKISVKIKRATAGTKVKAELYDKFKNKKDSETTMVYFGNKIYRGMSAKNAMLTTWGYPVRKNDYGNGPLQWIYESGSTTLYVYVQNGKVTSMQKINY